MSNVHWKAAGALHSLPLQGARMTCEICLRLVALGKLDVPVAANTIQRPENIGRYNAVEELSMRGNG